MNRLIIIAPSHYCEKVRLALRLADVPFDQEAHVPFFHMLAVRRAGGLRSTPTLVTADGTLGDSTDILGWLQNQPEARWKPYSHEPKLRDEILAWEERFDQRLGPHTRRYAYHHLLPMGPEARRCLSDGVPGWEARAVPVLWPLIRGAMQKLLRIDAAGAARSWKTIGEVFDEVAGALERRAGQPPARHLCGERLTAADITFASLAAPVLLPTGYGAWLPPLEALPQEAREQIAACRQHPAGRYALGVYDEIAERLTKDK